MWQTMAYALVVSAALAMTGYGLERLAVHLGLPRRSGWLVSITASVLFPVAAILAAPPKFVVEESAVQGLAQRPQDFAAQRVMASRALQIGPSTAPGTSAQVIASRASRFGQFAPWLSRWSVPTVRTILVFWLMCSVLLMAFVFAASARLRRLAASFPREVVQGVEVIVSERIGPALLGVWRPRLVVPRWFLTEPAGIQQLILEHERQHVLARDPLLLWAGIITVVALPWNLPLWWQLSRLRLAIELDCDARVLRTGARPQLYGEVLLSVTRRSTHLPAGALAMSQPVSARERRIQNLMPSSARPALWHLVRALGLGLAGVGVAFALDAPLVRTVVLPALQVSTAVPATGAVPVKGAVPLLPPPSSATQQAAFEQVQRAVLARYPQILTAPERGDTYVVAISLRGDGSISRSELRSSSRAGVREDVEALRQELLNGDGASMRSSPKGAPWIDGTVLPASVVLVYEIMPVGYDESRAPSLVQRAVRARYSHLMKPSDSEVLNRVTVFMTDDGQIDRATVDAVNVKSQQPPAPVKDPFARFRAMGLQPEQLSFMSGTGIQRRPDGTPGNAGVKIGADGILRRLPDETLLISYAWPRRATESADAGQPSFGHTDYEARRAIELALVEKYFPDAFTPGGKAQEQFWFVLSPAGEVVRAGRIKLEQGQGVSALLLQRLAPDLKSIGSMSPGEVRNAAGERASATFAWLAP